MIELEIHGGARIAEACQEAITLANDERDDVKFSFNDTDVIAHPGDTVDSLVSKWDAESEEKRRAYLNSDEYKQAESRRAEEYRRKSTASLKEAAQSEAEMRDAKSPWPYTPEQLCEYIDSVVDRQHDYGTCVYAMSLAAMAALNYVAHKLGTTGFQSSCADLDILRRTRHINGPFILLKGEDAVFPQYDLREKLNDALREWEPWIKEEANKKLSESPNAHPEVLAHWKRLAQS